MEATARRFVQALSEPHLSPQNVEDCLYGVSESSSARNVASESGFPSYKQRTAHGPRGEQPIRPNGNSGTATGEQHETRLNNKARKRCKKKKGESGEPAKGSWGVLDSRELTARGVVAALHVRGRVLHASGDAGGTQGGMCGNLVGPWPWPWHVAREVPCTPPWPTGTWPSASWARPFNTGTVQKPPSPFVSEELGLDFLESTHWPLRSGELLEEMRTKQALKRRVD